MNRHTASAATDIVIQQNSDYFPDFLLIKIRLPWPNKYEMTDYSSGLQVLLELSFPPINFRLRKA